MGLSTTPLVSRERAKASVKLCKSNTMVRQISRIMYALRGRVRGLANSGIPRLEAVSWRSRAENSSKNFNYSASLVCNFSGPNSSVSLYFFHFLIKKCLVFSFHCFLYRTLHIGEKKDSKGGLNCDHRGIRQAYTRWQGKWSKSRSCTCLVIYELKADDFRFILKENKRAQSLKLIFCKMLKYGRLWNCRDCEVWIIQITHAPSRSPSRRQLTFRIIIFKIAFSDIEPVSFPSECI